MLYRLSPVFGLLFHSLFQTPPGLAIYLQQGDTSLRSFSWIVQTSLNRAYPPNDRCSPRCIHPVRLAPLAFCGWASASAVPLSPSRASTWEDVWEVDT